VSRIDYYDDPAAPTANSLVPAVSAVVMDDDGRVLLQRRRDNELWALPGGAIDLGESVSQAVVREVEEETGYRVVPLYVVGVYSDPKHVFAYDDGEVRQEFSVCVAARVTGGQMAVSDESTDVGWFNAGEIADLPIHPRIRVRIDACLAGVRAAVA
jgi:8-oxo-dGTP pyrophosphatase MutT (NUDIX family)